jgi:hypothetical protein
MLVLSLGIVQGSLYNRALRDWPKGEEFASEDVSQICNFVLKIKRFEGAEHRNASNAGYLFFLDYNRTLKEMFSQQALPTSDVNFVTKSGTQKPGTKIGSYGDVVAMAGDFFGVRTPANVICNSESDKDHLFHRAFDDMYQASAGNELSKYVVLIKQQFDMEDRAIGVALSSGAKITVQQALACLPESRWDNKIFRDYGLISLLTFNFDHFSNCANSTYQVGHRLAMITAFEAGRRFYEGLGEKVFNLTLLLEQANADLKHAYFMNGFADHYLTDMFSSGHMRTPREAISQYCASSGLASYLLDAGDAGVSAQWMHDEDNRNGLFVENDRGDVFFCLGDDGFFDPRNAGNVDLIRLASQRSRDEVFEAFVSARNRTFPPPSKVLSFVPNFKRFSNKYDLNNTCPLFKSIAENGLMVRSPTTMLRSGAYFATHDLCDKEPCNASYERLIYYFLFGSPFAGSFQVFCPTTSISRTDYTTYDFSHLSVSHGTAG